MTIGAGVRFGPYEILAPIGAGGMGEVYRARDERLGREVAIKVLPAGFSADSDRLRRFEQEARAASALNHPNILAIYDVGTTVERAPYLVSELLEGETLRERLMAGPIPSRKAIDWGRQIAHGLAAAHGKGIVHRDLKPENLFLTKDGRVKILDFGLAKLIDADPIGARQTSLPTTPAGTQPGIVMGTIGYMSPEQARALPADHRADLFSLGAILYQMLSGRRAFQRDTAADTMGAILLHDPPELSVTNPTISPALELIVRHCLEKNAEERFQSARDVAFALDALSGASTTSGVVVAAGPPKLRWIRRALAGGALLAVLGAGYLVGDHNARNATLSHRMVRSVIPVAPAASLSRDSGAPLMAISPDGTRLVFVGSRGSTTQLYLRNVDQLVAEPIPGTEGGTFPFFSPDGEWIGFGSADGKLKKVSLSGGAALTVCTDCAVIGGSWGPNDTIIVGQGRGGLWRVPAAGGAAQQVTPANKDKGERTLRHPDFLPDGKAVLFTAGGWDEDSFDDARIEVLTLATGEKKVLIQGGMCGRYVASGHLVYARSGSLFAVPFDLATRSVTGVPVRVLEGVSTYPTLGGAQFSVSPGGTLVYAPGGPMRVDHQLVWVDRHGKVEPLTEASRAFLLPRISPDGQRIAILIDTALGHVWVYDLGRGTLTQLTFGENIQGSAVWTPDGKRLAYPWNLYGKIDIYWQPADGSGQPEQLTKGGSEFPGSWSPDGKTLVFAQHSDLWVLPIDGDRKPRLLLEERGLQANAAVSPDGHWLGYDSDESGRPEVYVRRFPGLEEKVQVSASGGESPIWSRDGRELFYREGENKLMAVTISTHATLTAARARIVFEDKESRYLQNGYDVAPDGRFVLVDAHENWPIQLNMVQNWFEELNRKVPTGR